MMVIDAEIGQRKEIHRYVKLDIAYLIKKAKMEGNISIPSITEEIKVTINAMVICVSFLLGLSI